MKKAISTMYVEQEITSKSSSYIYFIRNINHRVVWVKFSSFQQNMYTEAKEFCHTIYNADSPSEIPFPFCFKVAREMVTKIFSLSVVLPVGLISLCGSISHSKS